MSVRLTSKFLANTHTEATSVVSHDTIESLRIAKRQFEARARRAESAYWSTLVQFSDYTEQLSDQLACSKHETVRLKAQLHRQDAELSAQVQVAISVLRRQLQQLRRQNRRLVVEKDALEVELCILTERNSASDLINQSLAEEVKGLQLGNGGDDDVEF